MKRLPFPLLLILLFSAFLRFYQLGEVPVGFHRDEAFFGYNAYALLQTGKDMTGNLLPIHLQSFLFSPAGYSYLTIPFVAMFGLTEFAVRFVSALFAVLTVLVTYFLVKALFGEKLRSLAFLSALFLALSPWHINLSRTATENVIVAFLIALGVLLHLYWVKNRNWKILLVSFFCFSSTLFFYQAPRAFLPFFVPLLFIFFHPKPLKKNLIAPIVLFVIFIVFPIILILTSHDLSQRIRMLSIFQHEGTQLILNEQIRENGMNGNIFFTRFFHNKPINYSITFFENYFHHFSYDFLFTDKGFPDRYRVPQMGLLYFFEIPLLILGVWSLYRRDKKRAGFLTGWILLSPIGSSLTFHDVPNLQRTLFIFPALSIISAYGFLELLRVVGKIKFAPIIRFAFLGISFYFFAYYLHQYYVHQTYHRPWFRQEGYKELVTQLESIQGDYKKIVITNAESDPAILFLFYSKYDPKLIQKKFSTYSGTEYGMFPFENYVFVKDECPLRPTTKLDAKTSRPALSGQEGVLYINSGLCKIKDKRMQSLGSIKRKDGTVVFTLQVVKE